MTLEILILLASCFCTTLGIHCEGDTGINPLYEKEYTQHVNHPVNDLEYWRTAQNNFQVFGKFDGDPSSAIITADYNTAEGNLIHGITIDCSKGKWSSHVTNKDNEIENWLTGDLAEPCVDGKEFDIWLKIHQPKMMSWIFNAQALQYDIRETHHYHNAYIAYRNRTLEVPTKYGSNLGDNLKAKVTGSAVITRVTWGQCVSWPLSFASNCSAARMWVMARSKLADTDIPPGLGHFGADWQVYAPKCFLDSKYYDWLQFVHPDRTAYRGFPFCCCADMITGLIVNMENPCEEGEMGTWPNIICNRSCMQWAKVDLIREVMIEQDKQEELEELEEHLARLV